MAQQSDFPITWTIVPDDRAFSIAVDILTFFDSFYISMCFVLNSPVVNGIAQCALTKLGSGRVAFGFRNMLGVKAHNGEIRGIEFVFSNEDMPLASPAAFDGNRVSALIAVQYGRQFSSFWEEQLDVINAKFGTDAQTWPDILNFCRIVRNASSHSGRVNIPNVNSPVVGRWRGLELSAKNHGEVLIGKNQMELGDFLLLLHDLSMFLDANEVPLPFVPVPHS